MRIGISLIHFPLFTKKLEGVPVLNTPVLFSSEHLDSSKNNIYMNYCAFSVLSRIIS